MISGIYKITNLNNGKFYIGSSVDINQRWMKHLSALRGGKHHNKHLQSAFDIDGEENFVIEILEYCEELSLLTKEQIYLDETKCYVHTIGYNMCDKAANGKSKVFDSSKVFLVISPDGKRYIADGLDPFSRKMNLPLNVLRNVARGQVFDYKGWHCRYVEDSVDEWFNKLVRKPRPEKSAKQWKITFVDGREQFTCSIAEFCRTYGYSAGTMHGYLKGQRKSYKDIKDVQRQEIDYRELYEKWR